MQSLEEGYTDEEILEELEDCDYFIAKMSFYLEELEDCDYFIAKMSFY
ncbi:MAG: hypothetical protein ACTSP3_17585 [Candidatus Heimdallarchaeaceae archaeon]